MDKNMIGGGQRRIPASFHRALITNDTQAAGGREYESESYGRYSTVEAIGSIRYLLGDMGTLGTWSCAHLDPSRPLTARRARLLPAVSICPK